MSAYKKFSFSQPSRHSGTGKGRDNGIVVLRVSLIQKSIARYSVVFGVRLPLYTQTRVACNVQQIIKHFVHFSILKDPAVSHHDLCLRGVDWVRRYHHRCSLLWLGTRLLWSLPPWCWVKRTRGETRGARINSTPRRQRLRQFGILSARPYSRFTNRWGQAASRDSDSDSEAIFGIHSAVRSPETA